MKIIIEEFEKIAFNEASAPDFNIEERKLTISSKKDAYYSAGMFKGKINIEAQKNKLVKSEIKYETNGNKITPRAIISFFDATGVCLQSDFFSRTDTHFSIQSEIPENAETLEIYLELFAFYEGSVCFCMPELEFRDLIPHRKVNAASGFIESDGAAYGNLRRVVEVMDIAGNKENKPDIISFAECIYDIATGEKIYIKEDGEELKSIIDAARRNNIYTIFTAHEIDKNGLKYNTAFLISNKGEIKGKYRKVYLTEGELKSGLTPGEELPVFNTPFGKIGILICWDQWFPKASYELAEKGAEIIFWCTRGFHEERLITRARDNGIYYVVSHSTSGNCGIIEPSYGKFIARNTDKKQGFVCAEIDLDKRLESEYKSFGRMGANDKIMFLDEKNAYCE